MNYLLKMRICTILTVILYIFHGMAFAADNYFKIKLPKGVSIELPNNWVVLSGNKRITLDSTAKSRLELLGLQLETSELPFAANYFDNKGDTLGIMNIRYYPQLEATQADVKAAAPQDIKEMDEALKENFMAIEKSITSWTGTRKTTINGIVVLLTEYRRKSLTDNGKFRVRLVRVLAGNKSFTLTVSYHEGSDLLLKPITDKIIYSLMMEGISNNG